MENLKMFALCLYPRHLTDIKNLKYIPVGLGKNDFSKEWIRDNTGENITQKNPFYGEYTFHYWFWKNMINSLSNDTWIGFCGYRYFWQNSNEVIDAPKKKDILSRVPYEWKNYETIISCKQYTTNIKFKKIIKNGGLSFLFNKQTYMRKNQTIKFHFDVFHGKDILDNAIDLLDDKDRESFRDYVRNENSFHRWNMFICRSKKTIKEYYNSIFNWLNKCEELFGFELEGYAMRRVYGFLAERYLSYWFLRYSNCLSWQTFRYNLDENITR